MNEDDRALAIEFGEDPDDPKLIESYELLDGALAAYADEYHRKRSGFTDSEYDRRILPSRPTDTSTTKDAEDTTSSVEVVTEIVRILNFDLSVIRPQ